MLHNASSAKVKVAQRNDKTERVKKMSRKTNGRVHLTKEDWLHAALEELNSSGIDAVKVLPLAKKLGVTRGSFYWHFKDREELLRAMLAYWEEVLTDSVIGQAMTSTDTPQQQLENVLSNVLLNRQNRYDTAIAAWTMSNRSAAKHYAKVIRKRLRFIASLMLEAGQPQEVADFRAGMLLGFVVSYKVHTSRPTREKCLEDVRLCSQLAFG